MIARLKGIVWESKPLQLVVDVQGVGYQVAVPLTDSLPRVGQAVELFTHAVYKEDSAALYGFATAAERDYFVLLVEKVSGIGPKTALALMSNLPGGRLQSAVEGGDLETLKATPGVGKKTAERLLLELKGLSLSASVHPVASPAADAATALISLGYSQAEAQKAIGKVLIKTPGATTDELIRWALKKE